MLRSTAPPANMALFPIQAKRGLSNRMLLKWSSTSAWGNPTLLKVYSSWLLSEVRIMKMEGTSARKVASSRIPCFSALSGLAFERLMSPAPAHWPGA